MFDRGEVRCRIGLGSPPDIVASNNGIEVIKETESIEAVHDPRSPRTGCDSYLDTQSFCRVDVVFDSPALERHH